MKLSDNDIRCILAAAFGRQRQEITSVRRLDFCVVARSPGTKESFLYAPAGSKIFAVRYRLDCGILRRSEIARFVPAGEGVAARIYTPRRPTEDLHILISSESHYIYSSEKSLPVTVNPEFIDIIESRFGGVQ